MVTMSLYQEGRQAETRKEAKALVNPKVGVPAIQRGQVTWVQSHKAGAAVLGPTKQWGCSHSAVTMQAPCPQAAGRLYTHQKCSEQGAVSPGPCLPPLRTRVVVLLEWCAPGNPSVLGCQLWSGEPERKATQLSS